MCPSNDRHVLKRRIDPELSWTVQREGDVLLKEYCLHRWWGFVKRPWRREHGALSRLNKRQVPAPQTLGFDTPRFGVVRYRRGFVPGRAVDGLRQEQVLALSAHFRALHGAGVTNGDVSYPNLLLADGGEFMFIDYGRAHVFFMRSPLFHFYVGKELARARRRLFPSDVSQWRIFVSAYMRAVALPSWALAITRWSLSYWLRRWNIACEAADLQSS